MFTKKPDKEPTAFDLSRASPPIPPSGPMPNATSTMGRPGATRSGGESRIGADLVIIGDLVSKGEIQIDGEVQGDLHAANIVVGETARITGGLVADEVIVRGLVMGSIRGKRVVLQSSSKVEGDIFHSQLAIEQGAFFEGKSRRMDDPTAGVQRPELPLPAGLEGIAPAT
jgi:cytoskeletal protein CcmA (bactofilin family)